MSSELKRLGAKVVGLKAQRERVGVQKLRPLNWSRPESEEFTPPRRRTADERRFSTSDMRAIDLPGGAVLVIDTTEIIDEDALVILVPRTSADIHKVEEHQRKAQEELVAARVTALKESEVRYDKVFHALWNASIATQQNVLPVHAQARAVLILGGEDIPPRAQVFMPPSKRVNPQHLGYMRCPTTDVLYKEGSR